MVTVVVNADTAVEMVADGSGRTGVAAGAGIVLIDRVIAIIDQIATNQLNVLIVFLAILSLR